MLFCGLSSLYLCFFLACAILYTISSKSNTESSAGRSDLGLLFFLIPFLTIAIKWVIFYPGLLSPDSHAQLNQIAANTYSDVHPVAHTLFLRLLMQLNKELPIPAIPIFFQIVLLSIIIGSAWNWFYKRGVTLKLLLPTLIIWSFLPPIRIVTIYLWKDVFYAIALLLVSYMFIKIVEKKGAINFAEALLVVLGIAAAGLFRHNGLFVSLALIVVIISLAIHYSKSAYIFIAASSILVIILTKSLLPVFYKVGPNNNGTKYAIIGKAVVSVFANNGDYSEAELQKIESIMPLSVIKQQYDRKIGQKLIWESVFPADDKAYNFGTNLEGHGRDLARLFITLFPKNFLIMSNDILGSMSLMLQPQFVNPPLDSYLTYGIFSNNMIYFWIMFCAGLAISTKFKKAIYLLPFAPVLANVISMLISNISFEARYAYPTIVILPLIFIWVCYRANQPQKQLSE